MFERMQPWCDPPGSGTGLSRARKIIETHGGHIRLDDPPEGPGLTVHFTLPAAPAAGRAAAPKGKNHR